MCVNRLSIPKYPGILGIGRIGFLFPKNWGASQPPPKGALFREKKGARVQKLHHFPNSQDPCMVYLPTFG